MQLAYLIKVYCDGFGIENEQCNINSYFIGMIKRIQEHYSIDERPFVVYLNDAKNYSIKHNPMQLHYSTADCFDFIE